MYNYQIRETIYYIIIVKCKKKKKTQLVMAFITQVYQTIYIFDYTTMTNTLKTISRMFCVKANICVMNVCASLKR